MGGDVCKSLNSKNGADLVLLQLTGVPLGSLESLYSSTAFCMVSFFHLLSVSASWEEAFCLVLPLGGDPVFEVDLDCAWACACACAAVLLFLALTTPLILSLLNLPLTLGFCFVLAMVLKEIQGNTRKRLH